MHKYICEQIWTNINDPSAQTQAKIYIANKERDKQIQREKVFRVIRLPSQSLHTLIKDETPSFISW